MLILYNVLTTEHGANSIAMVVVVCCTSVQCSLVVIIITQVHKQAILKIYENIYDK